MAQRGRKSKLQVETAAAEALALSIKFERRYVGEDGSVEVWKFDTRKNANGPYETTMEYPKGTKTFEQIQEALPKTKRRYLNPETGKDVAYSRAKELGLIN
jgi:hypothetical protein